jgi:hypothetical protein
MDRMMMEWALERDREREKMWAVKRDRGRDGE